MCQWLKPVSSKHTEYNDKENIDKNVYIGYQEYYMLLRYYQYVVSTNALEGLLTNNESMYSLEINGNKYIYGYSKY